MDKHKLHNDNFIDALKNAIIGLAYTVKTQLNIKRQIEIAVFVIAIGLILKIPKIEFMFLIFSIALVIFAETVNTAIETVVDMYTDKYNEKAKNAKDVAAAGVLIMAISSVIIGIILGMIITPTLHNYVINLLEADNMVFLRDIKIESYLYAAILTFIFAIIMQWVTFIKMKKINMIESLKSVE